MSKTTFGDIIELVELLEHLYLLGFKEECGHSVVDTIEYFENRLVEEMCKTGINYIRECEYIYK